MNSAEHTTNSLLELYQEHMQQITELQHLVQQLYPPQHSSHDIATNYLNDRITLFRFLKKADYILPEAYKLVEANLAWRLEIGCDGVTPKELEGNQLWENGLFELRGQDRYGHPIITVRLGRYVPAPQQDYEAEEVKDRFLDYKRYITFVLECVRKLLWESSRRLAIDEHSLQATLILDLKNSSVSDLDHQLLSYVVELLKHRYPSCIAQVYVLNYSWIFGGIWQMLKVALPETARTRVSFPSSNDELNEHFDPEELSVDFGGLDTYQYAPESCEAFHYFGHPMSSIQPGTPTSSLSRVNSCDSIYFDAISTPLHSPGLRPHEGLGFLSMTPMMPMAPPSSGNNARPKLQRARSNSIPLMDLNASSAIQSYNRHTSYTSGTTNNKSTPMKASLLKHSKSSAHIPSFMTSPSIETDLPTQYPLSKKERSMISRRSTADPNNRKRSRFYRMILKPNSFFMKIVSAQRDGRQKIVKVVKSFADKIVHADIKTLLYWIMAVIMLRGQIWQLITANALKLLTMTGETDNLLIWTEY
ncbi:hypothetical protein BGZ76_007877 [Entomortierella beljakovae]|nr:hypothetical protein BGZ76_007877 [Entomortierella beljakovae]